MHPVSRLQVTELYLPARSKGGRSTLIVARILDSAMSRSDFNTGEIPSRLQLRSGTNLLELTVSSVITTAPIDDDESALVTEDEIPDSYPAYLEEGLFLLIAPDRS